MRLPDDLTVADFVGIFVLGVLLSPIQFGLAMWLGIL